MEGQGTPRLDPTTRRRGKDGIYLDRIAKGKEGIRKLQ